MARNWAIFGSTALLALGLAPSTYAQSERSLAESALARQAEQIKPTAAELRWQQIPWEVDPHEAIALAKKEKRPLFVWIAGGRRRDGVPIERC
jgi:hypothetical protein